jgi:ribosome-binding factor A
MSQRTERVARSVQEALGELLPTIKDPRVTEAGFITITHVRISPDLSQARVLVSLFEGSEEKRNDLIKGLDRSRGFLEREIGRRLHAKRVPHLTFVLDETSDQAGKIDAIFAELKEEEERKKKEPSGE